MISKSVRYQYINIYTNICPDKRIVKDPCIGKYLIHGSFLLVKESFDLVVIFIYINHRVRLYITSVIIRVINLYPSLAYTIIQGIIGFNGISL